MDTGGRRVERSTLLGRLARTGAPRLVVRCELPLELALARAAQREHDPARISDAGPRIVAEQYRSFQPLEELPPGDVLGLDTRPALQTQAFEVTRAIDRLLMARAGAGATTTRRSPARPPAALPGARRESASR
jgi:predicted kinase